MLWPLLGSSSLLNWFLGSAIPRASEGDRVYSLGLSSAATSPLSEQEGSWMLMFYTRSPQRQSSYTFVGDCLSVLAHLWHWGAHCPSKDPFPMWDSLDSWKGLSQSYIFRSSSYGLEQPGSSLVFLQHAICGLALGRTGGISVCSVPCKGTGNC